ncbi:MAG: hypothetical protein IJ217_03770 [Clostridia bacterium]|nr:hypothetical protein [Clostridia bacterium]
MKRLTALLLAVLMLFALFSYTAVAESGTNDDAVRMMTTRVNYKGFTLIDGSTVYVNLNDSFEIFVFGFMQRPTAENAVPDLSTLTLYYSWDNGPATPLPLEGKTISILEIPEDFEANSIHRLQVEWVINDSPHGYIGNSNVVTLYVLIA